MAELFQTTSQNITIHLKNIFEEKELEEKATCKDFLQVQKESSREVEREYRKFKDTQRKMIAESDFEKVIMKIDNRSKK